MDAGHPWLAKTLDWVMRPMYPARRFVVPEASGRVLEVGVGTGLNFGLYGGGVTELIGVDPDPYMLERARPRAAELPFKARLHQAGAEAMPLDTDSVDTAVVTFTLCTIPDPDGALREIRRVLKPGGRMLFVEHTRSPQGMMATAQDLLTPLWKVIGGGCHLNRPAVQMIRDNGFEVPETQAVWRDTWTLFPVYRGMALKSV